MRVLIALHRLRYTGGVLPEPPDHGRDGSRARSADVLVGRARPAQLQLLRHPTGHGRGHARRMLFESRRLHFRRQDPPRPRCQGI